MNKHNLIALAVIGVVLYAILPHAIFALALITLPLAGPAYLWHRHHHSAAQVRRWGKKAIAKHGMASTWDILRVASFIAMRRHAKIVRPSFAGKACRNVLEVAIPLCRVGWFRVWESVEGVIGVFGGPRTGKSRFLINPILDAPGAVISTSTRLDLLKKTRRLRSRKGPVLVFNPAGLGNELNTAKFDPLYGCEHPLTALERAHDMLPLTSGTKAEREYWVNRGRSILAVLMHAAALGNLTMLAVQRWISDPKEHLAEIVGYLRQSTELAFISEATQFAHSHDGPRSSIATTIMPALMWLTQPSAVASTMDGAQIDVAWLLDNNVALYLLGREEVQTVPLVSALIGYIAREYRRLAALSPEGRLDPPPRFVLDEIAIVAPVPLRSWVTDMGGSGITVIYGCQSRAQLVHTFGETEADAIINNTSSLLCFGNNRARTENDFWSHLAGQRDEKVPSYDAAGKNVTGHSTRSVPVISPAMFASLRRGKVVCFRRGMSPVVGRAKRGSRRWDVMVASVLDAFTRCRPAALPVPTSPASPASASTTPAGSQLNGHSDRVGTRV